jgi:hypothetical protein
MAASVINVTLAHSARSLAMIDMIGFTPAGGNDLLGRHADPGIAAALTFGRSLHGVNVSCEPDQNQNVNVSRPAILQLNVVISITGYAPFDTVRL